MQFRTGRANPAPEPGLVLHVSGSRSWSTAANPEFGHPPWGVRSMPWKARTDASPVRAPATLPGG